MRRILLGFIGDKKPSLVIHADGSMDGSDEVVENERCREFLLSRYRSLGSTFQEAYNAVVEHYADKKKRAILLGRTTHQSRNKRRLRK